MVPSAIFFDLSSRCGLVWTDIECQYTLEELIELAKRNVAKTETAQSKPRPKRKGAKEKSYPLEERILRAHVEGQSHELTAEIANVKTPDGR